MKIIIALATTAALAAASAEAAVTTIDFNAYAGGTSITNQYAAQGVLFSSRTGTSVFNAAISTYFPGFGTPDAAITNSRDGAGDRQQFLVIDFTSAVSNVSFGYNNYGGFFTGNNFKAYDGLGNLLQTLSPTGASTSALETISFTVGGIRKIELEQPGQGWIFAVDNLSFGAVPEPQSWALMIAGFGLVGAAMRRRVAVAA